MSEVTREIIELAKGAKDVEGSVDPNLLLMSHRGAFGEILARPEALFSDGDTVDRLEIARNLKQGINLLKESNDPDHIRVVERINRDFWINDYLVYNQSVDEKYRVKGREVMQWLSRASLKAIGVFSEWNVERRDSLQNRLNSDASELIDITIGKTEKLIDLDFFPKIALDKVVAATKKYGSFVAIDTFEVALKGHIGYVQEGGVLALSNLYGFRTEQSEITADIENTAFHEFLHLSEIVGHSGFFLGHNSPKLHNRWQGEGFVSHSTAVAEVNRHGPQVAVLYPSDRLGGTVTSYPAERDLMGFVSEPAMANVPADLWAAAYFSDVGSMVRRDVDRRLNKAFRDIFEDIDGYGMFNSAYESLWDARDSKARELLIEKVNQRIAILMGNDWLEEITEDVDVSGPAGQFWEVRDVVEGWQQYFN